MRQRGLVIVESHALAATYLRGLFDHTWQICVIDTPGDVFSMNVFPVNRCVVLIDVGTLRLPVVSFVAELVKAPAQVEVVVLGPTSEAIRIALVRRSVSAFVDYGNATSLPTLADAVWNGDVLLPLTELRHALLQVARRGGNTQQLTRMELKVLGLVERELRNKEIAAALGISERTVRFHVSHLINKLGLLDRSEVAKAAKAGAVDLLIG